MANEELIGHDVFQLLRPDQLRTISETAQEVLFKVLIDEVTRGTIFGSCVCFQIDSYTRTAQCTEDSKLLKVRAATLKKLLDDDPVLGYAVQTLVSRVYFKRYIDTAQKLQAILRTMPIEAI